MRVEYKEWGAIIQVCIDHARSESDDTEEMVVQVWPQTWPNSGCGTLPKGHLVLHAFWTAPTVLISTKVGGEVIYFVYHYGRLAYSVQDATDLFYRQVEHCKLTEADNPDRETYGTICSS